MGTAIDSTVQYMMPSESEGKKTELATYSLTGTDAFLSQPRRLCALPALGSDGGPALARVSMSHSSRLIESTSIVALRRLGTKR